MRRSVMAYTDCVDLGRSINIQTVFICLWVCAFCIATVKSDARRPLVHLKSIEGLVET